MDQKSADLFPTDRPIPASQMIGRKDDVNEIAASLQGGINLVVAGPRRTGKTSVCEAALIRCSKAKQYSVAVDLFGIADAAQLAEAIVTATIANRPAVKRAVFAARKAGRLIAGAAGTSAVVKIKGEFGEDIEIAFRPELAVRDPERYLDYALQLPEKIAKADGKQLVFFFDEFQEVANPRKPYGDPDALTKKMRSIFQRSDSVSFLFAGSVEHLMRDLFVPSKRAFSQFGQFHDLRPILEHDWESGLRERFEAGDLKITDQALSRIVELGELHPRVTMLISQKTHLLTVMLDIKQINTDTVEQGYLMALVGDKENNEQSVERIRIAHRLGLQVSFALANGEKYYGIGRPSEVQRALRELLVMGFVEHRTRGDWRITNPLLKRYLIDMSAT